MMGKDRWLVAALSGLLPCAPAALAQAAPADSPAAQLQPAAAADQFYPSERLIRWFLTETSRRMARDYGFDEYQQQLAQEALTENMLKFMKEHEPELKPLVNEFFDATYGDTPPEAEFVAGWSDRALPMLEKLRGVLGETGEQMRDFMTEEQELRLDGALAALEAGVEVVDRRLRSWSDGAFDWETEWAGSPKARLIEQDRKRELKSRMEEARSARINPAGASPSVAEAPAKAALAAAATPKDEWDIYVDGFIARYNLDDRQSQQARLLLDAHKERRDQYLRQRGPEMEKIEALFAKATAPDKVQAAEAEYQQLQKPISTIFDVLKKKLDKLPTRAQRAAAVSSEPPSQPAAPVEPTKAKNE